MNQTDPLCIAIRAAVGCRSRCGAVRERAAGARRRRRDRARAEDGWILRLEDQRHPARAAAAAAGRRAAAAANRKKPQRRCRRRPPVARRDLAVLVDRHRSADPAARRARDRPRRAAGGVAPLQPLLADADADVRQMAAFALGLLADKAAVPALTTALQDADPRVRGRAAEALGLIGDARAGRRPSAQMVAAATSSAGAIAAMPPDDETVAAAPEADAFGSGCSRSCG